MKKLFVALPIAALLLAGCSGPSNEAAGSDVAGQASEQVTPTPTSSPRNTAMPAGAFALTTKSGAEIKFQMPTPPSDPALTELEAFRNQAQGPAVTYLVADVDNRNGTDGVNMYQVNAYDAEGQQYTFTTVTDMLAYWGPSMNEDGTHTFLDGRTVDSSEGSLLRDMSTKLNNSIDNFADPAARKTMILATPVVDLPNEFTRVSVSPLGGLDDPEEATPAS